MFLHHETYRLLTLERMGRYRREAAADRQSRIAALAGHVDQAPRGIGAAAQAVWAAVRALVPSRREGGPVCGDSRRSAS